MAVCKRTLLSLWQQLYQRSVIMRMMTVLVTCLLDLSRKTSSQSAAYAPWQTTGRKQGMAIQGESLKKKKDFIYLNRGFLMHYNFSVIVDNIHYTNDHRSIEPFHNIVDWQNRVRMMLRQSAQGRTRATEFSLNHDWWNGSAKDEHSAYDQHF